MILKLSHLSSAILQGCKMTCSDCTFLSQIDEVIDSSPFTEETSSSKDVKRLSPLVKSSTMRMVLISQPVLQMLSIYPMFYWAFSRSSPYCLKNCILQSFHSWGLCTWYRRNYLLYSNLMFRVELTSIPLTTDPQSRQLLNRTDYLGSR